MCKQFNGERISFQQMVQEQLDIHMQKKKKKITLTWASTLYKKKNNNLKMDHRPKCKI